MAYLQETSTYLNLSEQILHLIVNFVRKVWVFEENIINELLSNRILQTWQYNQNNSISMLNSSCIRGSIFQVGSIVSF